MSGGRARLVTPFKNQVGRFRDEISLGFRSPHDFLRQFD
jgi:hypothetical protein